MSQPVPPGQLQIEGHFTGTVTSASHVLEISIPLNYEVSSSDIEPLIVAFHTQAQAAEAAALGASEDSVRSSRQDAGSKLWQDLLAILSGDANGKECRAREIMKMAQQAKTVREMPTEDVQLNTSDDLGQFRREDSPRATLMVEISAKEALLEQVMLERQRLQQENESLKEQLSEGGLKRFMRKASHALAGGVKEFEHALHVGKDDPKYLSERSQGDDEHLPSQAIGEGFISLTGTYLGHVTTNTHNLEVVLPLDGPVPVAPVVEIIHALSGDDDIASPRSASVDGPGHVDPGVWHHLLNILDTDETRELIAARALGSQTHRDLLRSTATQEELAAEVQRLKAELSERAVKLETVEGAQSKLRIEADDLRTRNATLAGYLASAETSAQKLRRTLTETGGEPRQQDNPAQPRNGAPPPNGTAPQQQLQSPSWQQRPPVESGRIAAPPPLLTPEAKLPESLANRPQPAAPGSGEQLPSAARVHYNNCSTSATPSISSTPPRAATPPAKQAELTPRLQLTDAALVADLQELERWAKELRSLKTL